MDLLPKCEVESRLRNLQSWMQGASVDAVLVLQNADLYYFSGTIQAGILCLPATGEAVYLVQKSPARAREESPWPRIVPMTSLRKAGDLLAGEGIARLGRVGLEMDVLPASQYFRLQGVFPGVTFVDASEAIRRVRMVKSSYEVGQIRQAAAQLRAAFAEIPRWARPGVSELDVSAHLESFLRSRGHPGITRARSFNFEIAYGVVVAGPSASHATPNPGPVGFFGLYPALPNGASRALLASGQTLMVDAVGGYGGYVADKTRTFAIGAPAPHLCAAHSFVLGLIREIEGMLKPGTPCSQIYQHVLGRVSESPYAEVFMGVGDSRVRFIGHGIGLEIDELPVLTAGSDMPLEAGMIIAVEPKVFFPEGGVGIENTYLITEKGAENLTDFTEDLIPVPAAVDPGGRTGREPT